MDKVRAGCGLGRQMRLPGTPPARANRNCVDSFKVPVPLGDHGTRHHALDTANISIQEGISG